MTVPVLMTVPVAVVNVREAGVIVRQRLMNMFVRMRLVRINARWVRVLMMCIVNMAVRTVVMTSRSTFVSFLN